MTPGLLLVRGPVDAVTGWARRGLVAVRVSALGGWSAVHLADGVARSAPPYDCAALALLARPLPARLRPAIGCFVVDGLTVVSVRPAGRRATQRWGVASDRDGYLTLPGLAPARPHDLAVAAGVPARTGDVAALLAGSGRSGVAWAGALFRALGLTVAADLVGGATREALLVEPEPASVAAFDAMTAEHAAHLVELKGHQ